MCRTPLVLENSLNLLVFTFDANDHGIFILRVNSSCIFLREGDSGLWNLELAFNLGHHVFNKVLEDLVHHLLVHGVVVFEPERH